MQHSCHSVARGLKALYMTVSMTMMTCKDEKSEANRKEKDLQVLAHLVCHLVQRAHVHPASDEAWVVSHQFEDLDVVTQLALRQGDKLHCQLI